MSQEASSEVEALRDEVNKLSRVMSEVMGEEFDSIMARQIENQQSTLRWFVQALAVSVATLELLLEKGVLDEEDCRARILRVQERLLRSADGLGSSPDITSVLERSP